jgi:hypothetical protein
MLKGINWLGVVVAVVLMEALGFAWYGPLFGKIWMAALGHTPDMSNQAVMMSLGVVDAVIVVVGLAWLLGRLGAGSLTAALSGALAAWFFFDFTTMAVDYLYQGQSATLVGVNMGFQLASYLIAGACLALVRLPAAKPA